MEVHRQIKDAPQGVHSKGHDRALNMPARRRSIEGRFFCLPSSFVNNFGNSVVRSLAIYSTG